jgi:hypothetical protein
MFDTWSDAELLVQIEGAHRHEAMAMATKLAAIAQLLARRTEEQLAIEADAKSMITGFAATAAEVGAAMNMSAARARAFVRQGEDLATRLPAVGALLAQGEVDFATVEIVLSRTELVDDDLIAQVDADLAEAITGWGSWSRKAVINAVDQAVHTVDRDAAKKRRVRAYDDRHVSIEVGLDGTAKLRATFSADEGAAYEARLSAMAKSVCGNDPRTLRQRRLDALVALRDGHQLACGCPDPHCPSRPAHQDPAAPEQHAQASTQPAAPAPATQVVINVIATAATVAGHSEAPGYLAGIGVIDAELVRELARDATRRLVEEPIVSEKQALRYRPSAALARFIRCRDLTCRFPGCTVPAERCDIDHTEPFNHDDPTAGGLTVAENLACYCREHHRDKTFHPGWRDQQLADGTIIWTSPIGRTYRTTPGGTALFGDMRRKRRPEEAKRIAKARQRLHQHRHTSTFNRYRNEEAKEEVRVRLWRNQFRRFHILFQGESTQTKPSKSPFARFVNDPIEPEELPPNWQPPPLNTIDPDQPPPF